MLYFTCRFRSRAWKVLSTPRQHGPLCGFSLARADDDGICWVHHNDCERDEFVLQPAFMIQYLNEKKVEVEGNLVGPVHSLLRVPASELPATVIFPCVVVFPPVCLRASCSCSGLPNSPLPTPHAISRPSALHPFVIPHQTKPRGA
jgi:hypothetical protein